MEHLREKHGGLSSFWNTVLFLQYKFELAQHIQNLDLKISYF